MHAIRASGTDRGFSFIELLAYMAIAALLILAAIPQFNNYRGQARDAATVSDVRNVAVALEAWAIDHPGEQFPNIRSNWTNNFTIPPQTMGMDILAAAGVKLSSGTDLWVSDRTQWSWPTSTTFTRPGQAFCIYAINLDGKGYSSDYSLFGYHSGNGGMGVNCGTK